MRFQFETMAGFVNYFTTKLRLLSTTVQYWFPMRYVAAQLIPDIPNSFDDISNYTACFVRKLGKSYD